MDDLRWGLQMTVLGMGLVFGLLALLWGLLTLVQRLDRSGQAAALPAPATAATADAGAVEVPTAAGATANGMDAELVAAILTATLAHRALRRREAAPVMRSYLPGSQASRWLGAGRARQLQHWQRRGKA